MDIQDWQGFYGFAINTENNFKTILDQMEAAKQELQAAKVLADQQAKQIISLNEQINQKNQHIAELEKLVDTPTKQITTPTEEKK